MTPRFFTRGTGPLPEDHSNDGEQQVTAAPETEHPIPAVDSEDPSVPDWSVIDPMITFKDLFSPSDFSGKRTPGTGSTSLRDWHQDYLGEDYQYTTLDLGEDEEGPVEATLVRFRPKGFVHPARAILYVHGWSDYFFQTETAEFWNEQGVAFYAVDLRKYGRSLRPGQSAGYTTSLSVYSEELSASIDIMRQELGPNVSIMLMGHSTGGLVCSLWAHHNPGEVTGLILNSPWLELQGSSIVRILANPGLQQIARLNPKSPLPNIDAGFYARTVSKEFGGEWEFNPEWRPTLSHPVRAGWLSAIVAGHAEVARGLDIQVPVLVLASTKTAIYVRWSEEIRTGDSVLDVDVICRRAVQLGPNVTINRIKNGLHDLALSPHPVRDRYYAAIFKWATAYGWNS